MINRELVEPDYMRGKVPLCMDQFSKIFTRTRVPRVDWYNFILDIPLP